MKFKVGDKVKVKDGIIGARCISTIAKIPNYSSSVSNDKYHLKGTPEIRRANKREGHEVYDYSFWENELILVKNEQSSPEYVAVKKSELEKLKKDLKFANNTIKDVTKDRDNLLKIIDRIKEYLDKLG
jgi:hypothetical protein